MEVMIDMKMGVRKPSVKKSIKARTTGRVKRSIKKSVNPLYGKKGMGFIKDPERSVKNAIYHRTTVGVGDIIDQTTSSFEPSVTDNSASGNGVFIFLIVICSLLAALGLLLTIVMPVAGIAAIIFGVFGVVYSVRHIRNNKQ